MDGYIKKVNMELFSRGKLNFVTFGYVGIILFIYRNFTHFLRNFAELAGSGAVINSLLTSIFMIVIVKFVMSLCRYMGSINLLERCGEYLGKPIKYLIGIIVLLFALISVINAVIEFSELCKIITFKTAPLWFPVIFFCIAAFFAQRSKISSLLGVFSVITPIIIILLIIFFAASLRYGEVNNLFPVFGIDIKSTFISGLRSVSIYSDFILLLFSGVLFEDAEIIKTSKTIEISAIIGALINFFAVLVFTLCVSYPFSKDIVNPLYNITEIVYYGKFFQRADGFYMLTAAVTGMLYIAYVSNIIGGITLKLFKVKNNITLSLFYALIVGILSCIFSEKRLSGILDFYALNLSFIIGILLPCVLAVLTAVVYRCKKTKS